jgi:hypothetical protein
LVPIPAEFFKHGTEITQPSLSEFAELALFKQGEGNEASARGFTRGLIPRYRLFGRNGLSPYHTRRFEIPVQFAGVDLEAPGLLAADRGELALADRAAHGRFAKAGLASGGAQGQEKATDSTVAWSRLTPIRGGVSIRYVVHGA